MQGPRFTLQPRKERRKLLDSWLRMELFCQMTSTIAGSIRHFIIALVLNGPMRRWCVFKERAFQQARPLTALRVKMLSPACWFTWCHCFGWIWHLMLFYQLPTTINNNNNKPGWSCIQSVCCIVCHLASHLLTYIQCGVWTCGCGILVGFSLLNWFYILLYMQDLEREKKRKRRKKSHKIIKFWYLAIWKQMNNC